MLLQRWWYEFGLSRAGRERSADVLLMPSNFTVRPAGIPQVVTILDVNFIVSPGTYEAGVVRYATWAWKRALRDADAITTISMFSRREIARHLGTDAKRIHVVYPGLEPPIPTAATEPIHPRPYALYVGATEHHKNLGVLFDAWTRDLPGGLDLAIVGRPGRNHREVLRRAARLSDRVVVRDDVSDAELEVWYRYARVFLFPSLTEGFGYPPLEAMQRGVPVVASNAGAMPEVLGDAAMFHDPTDVDAIRSLVSCLAEDETRRGELVAAGRERAARYSWESSASQMEIILRRAVRRHRG